MCYSIQELFYYPTLRILVHNNKERTSIDIIGGQKWSVILGMPWLGHHNLEINWKIEEVKMTRCPDKCGKKWKAGRQTKLGWKKQEEREKKKEKRRPAIEEVKMIERIMEEKEDEEKDLIELRAIDEMVP